MLVFGHDGHLAGDVTCGSTSTGLGSRKTSGKNGGTTGDDRCIIIVFLMKLVVCNLRTYIWWLLAYLH